MKNLAFPAVLAFGLFGSSQAYAGGEIFDNQNSCTSNNCNAIIMNGTIKSFGSSAGKWVAEVFSSGSECLRIHVTGQFADLETVVVAPNGTVYRNDDTSLADTRPLVKINPTPNNGWYTVSIGRFNGAADNGNFAVRYGRYNLGNVNCSSSTPAIGPETAAAKSASAVLGAKAGEPGAR